MVQPPRTPPRFVPTLTEVVQLPGSAPVPERAGGSEEPRRTTVWSAPLVPSALPIAAPLPGAWPPVAERPAQGHPGSAFPADRSAALATDGPAAGAPSPQRSAAENRLLPEGVEEFIVHRVMQRVDVVLDQRLRDAIATVVQEQTRSVLPRLREEIESVVRHAVYEAVADELASGTPKAPPR